MRVGDREQGGHTGSCVKVGDQDQSGHRGRVMVGD